MLKIIKQLLLKLIDDIDAGNTNIDEETAISIMLSIKELSCRDIPMSKYSACLYLNISRATFDNLIKEGKLPKGKKSAGFKELSWTKKDLDTAINNINKSNNKNENI